MEKISLKAYIALIGNQSAAKLFDCSPATTKSWRYGLRQPSIRQAKKIILASEGKLDFESIFGPLDESNTETPAQTKNVELNLKKLDINNELSPASLNNTSEVSESIEQELTELKNYFEKGLIDEEIYKAKQKELLGL